MIKLMPPARFVSFLVSLNQPVICDWTRSCVSSVFRFICQQSICAPVPSFKAHWGDSVGMFQWYSGANLHPQRNAPSPGHASSVLLTCLKACGGSLWNAAGKSHHNSGCTAVLLSAPCGQAERVAPITRCRTDNSGCRAVRWQLPDVGEVFYAACLMQPGALKALDRAGAITELVQKQPELFVKCNHWVWHAHVSASSYSFFSPPLHCELI